VDFLRIQGSKLKFRSRFFLVAMERQDSAQPSKVGITVTTKLSKRSHERNLLKRRLREVFRKGEIPQGFNLVIIALNGALSLSYAEIERELCFILRKVRRG